MSKSTYKRLQQSLQDHLAARKRKVEAAMTAAGLSWHPARYPVNPTETEAYRAGFQQSCNAAWKAACRGDLIQERWDLADSTSVGNGETDGWNAVAKALSRI